MTAALLACEKQHVEPDLSPCVTSLACWWREIGDLEQLLGYARSTRAGRDAWDALVVSEVPAPNLALYVELRACVGLWQRLTSGRAMVWPSLLDRLLAVAEAERLDLSRYGLLAAFRLRQALQALDVNPTGRRNGAAA
jgi:hypothetical protein